MSKIKTFLTSSIGRKVIMGLSGLLMLAFLVLHLLENLLLFAGAETFNSYSHALVSNPLIYIPELILLALFVSHFATGFVLTAKNREARPLPYRNKKPAGHTSRKSLASSTMIFSGLVLLAFVPIHIYTFKFGAHYAWPADPEMRDLHRLVIETFRSGPWVAWYVFALVVIGFHAWHGFGSAFESLGLGYRRALRNAGKAVAVVLTAGFITIPVVIYLLGVNP